MRRGSKGSAPFRALSPCPSRAARGSAAVGQAVPADLHDDDSYLVDPASSHMLVSKIKPCMSKFTLSHGETANGSLNQSRFLR